MPPVAFRRGRISMRTVHSMSPESDFRFAICDWRLAIGDWKNPQTQTQKSKGGSMNAEDLKRRTKKFALRVIKVVAALPNSPVGRTIGNQLVKSGTSVGANYRSSCRARSKAEFVSKLGTVIEEADESAY